MTAAAAQVAVPTTAARPAMTDLSGCPRSPFLPSALSALPSTEGVLVAVVGAVFDEIPAALPTRRRNKSLV